MSILNNTLKEDGKGGVQFTQPKKTIYIKSPNELGNEIFSKLSPTVGSFEGLQSLFEKLNGALTKRLNMPISGIPAGADEKIIDYKDIYFLIMNKLRDTDAPSILTDEAMKVFFDATTDIQLTSKAEKNAPVNSGALQMKQKDAAMDDLLATFTQQAAQSPQQTTQAQTQTTQKASDAGGNAGGVEGKSNGG